jgi:hypothetical protein
MRIKVVVPSGAGKSTFEVFILLILRHGSTRVGVAIQICSGPRAGGRQ